MKMRKGLFVAMMFICYTTLVVAQKKEDAAFSSQYTSYGDKIEVNGAMSNHKMWEAYAALKVTDTLVSKFTGRVVDVCKVKGCWMTLELENGQEAMVRFKDYGFFMPVDVVGKKVVVNGLAFVEEMSVEDQKHYASDAGKSEKEVALITTAKRTYGFEADGVLIEQ